MSRPVVIRMGALGDTVMTLPLIKAIAEQTGQPCDVVGHALWVPMVCAGLPYVGEVRPLVTSKLPVWLHPASRSMRSWLRSRGDGPVLLAENRQRIHDLSEGVTGPRYSVNDLPPIRQVEHQSEKLHRLLIHNGLIDASQQLEPPTLPVRDEEIAQAQAFCAQHFPHDSHDAPLICVQLGSSATRRRSAAPDRASNTKWWPIENWVAVLRQVKETTGGKLRIMAMGSTAERQVAQSLIAAAPDLNIVDGTGTTLEQLKARLRCATALLSVDTGVAHVAAAISCPSVVLFGEGDPRANRPYPNQAQVSLLYAPEQPPLDDLHTESTFDKYPNEDTGQRTLYCR